jgi:hypothetical protein
MEASNVDSQSALHAAVSASRPALRRDQALLDRLLYKSKNQHGKSVYFRRLKQVSKFHRSQAVVRCVWGEKEGNTAKDSDRQTQRRYCESACDFLINLYKVSRVLLGMISRTHFMPFCVCVTGILARFATIHQRVGSYIYMYVCVYICRSYVSIYICTHTQNTTHTQPTHTHVASVFGVSASPRHEQPAWAQQRLQWGQRL